MKKILFATTALVATASVAAADVTFSGYGRFGVMYSGSTDATAASAVTLPSYTQIDLGVDINVLENLTIGLRALNVTDEYGFTSANFRGISPTAPVRYTSTIPGRNFSLSANYKF